MHRMITSTRVPRHVLALTMVYFYVRKAIHRIDPPPPSK